MITHITSLDLITNDGHVYFFDDGYGELAIMFKGPRQGERGQDRLSKSQIKTLINFLSEWVEAE